MHDAGPRRLTYVRLVTVHNEGMEEEGDDGSRGRESGFQVNL